MLSGLSLFKAISKYSEKEMTKYANLIISDNRGIETYIQNTYPWARTTFIAYGTDLSKTTLTAEDDPVRDCIRNGRLKKKITICNWVDLFLKTITKLRFVNL